MRNNRDLFTNCCDPIADIQQIRNRAMGAYLTLLDNATVNGEVLACLDDVVVYAGRIQKWFINHPEILNLK